MDRRLYRAEQDYEDALKTLTQAEKQLNKAREKLAEAKEEKLELEFPKLADTVNMCVSNLVKLATACKRTTITTDLVEMYAKSLSDEAFKSLSSTSKSEEDAFVLKRIKSKVAAHKEPHQSRLAMKAFQPLTNLVQFLMTTTRPLV